MDKNCSGLSDLTESLGVLSLDNLKAFGESSTNSSTSVGSNRLGDRLHKERMKALETLQKSEKLTKLDSAKQQDSKTTANKENLKVSSHTINASKLNGTDYVPFRRPTAINISDLITDESINLECSNNLNKPSATPTEIKVSFEPAEITGRSTHYTMEQRHSQNIRKASIAATSSRLSVGDILASSFAPKARGLCEVLRVSNAADLSDLCSMASSSHVSRSLPRTADMSQASSATGAVANTFSMCGSAVDAAAFESEDFQPAELMTSKLLMDEISWAQEFATIPTVALSKEAKAKKANDFDVHSNSSSMSSLDPNFSVGRFFNQRSEELKNIIQSMSPDRVRTPVALVDETDSTMTSSALSTSISKQHPSVLLTPQIDNRTYSKVGSERKVAPAKPRQTNNGRHESKDSGNETKENDSYLLTLSCIDRMLNTDLDTDVSDAAFIDQLLKKAKRYKSPLKRDWSQSNDHSTTSKKSPVSATERRKATDLDPKVDIITDLLWDNKENIDPQKKLGTSVADTLSFSESLLDSTDMKELQPSIGQPRSPLSPLQLNVPQLKFTSDTGDEADVDEWPAVEELGTVSGKTPARHTRSRSRSPNKSIPKISPEHVRKSPPIKIISKGGHSKQLSKSPSVATSTQIPEALPETTSTQLQNSATHLNATKPPKSPASANKNEEPPKPLSSTRLDDRKTDDCDSPNLSKLNGRSTVSGNGAAQLSEETLTPDGSLYNSVRGGGGGSAASSPCSFGSPQQSSPIASVGYKQRGCGNCSPKFRNINRAEHGYAHNGEYRNTSSPSSSESGVTTNAHGVVPVRTGSSSSLRSGGVGRSISRCSSSSEFSHRPGKTVPLKVTNLQLSWGSTRMRSASRKSIQVKNIANKRLVLRVEVHGPGYKLENMHSNTLTLQSQECRTIIVNFCPTVTGVAIGKLSFYAPQGTLSSSATAYAAFLDIPLNGYGGHCSVLAQEVLIGPLGMPFLQLGYLHELGYPLERSIKIYNKGPLLGFAMLSIDSVGMRLPRLCDAFEVQPSAMLIAPGSAVIARVLFRPQRDDIKKIARQTKTVLTLANLRLISGDEANRQRMRRLVQHMSEEERAKMNPGRTLDKLWGTFPEEPEMPELEAFKEKPEVTFDLLLHMRVHEVALTINVYSMDDTIKSSSSLCFPDDDETVLFRTVCSPMSSPEPMLDRVDELLEEGENECAANVRVEREGFWAVVPTNIKFYLGEKRQVLWECLFIRNLFRSRQYFEITCNRKDVIRIEPSDGYVEPLEHLEVDVHLLLEKLVASNTPNNEIIITVCMKNECIKVPVTISEAARPLERAVRA